jgi:glutaredoxin 3
MLTIDAWRLCPGLARAPGLYQIDDDEETIVPKVEIYTTALCPYCRRAKALLDKKGVAYTEYEVDVTPGKLDEMLKRSAGRGTVPQIFIDDRGIGGSDDLYALDRQGKLDRLLGRAA